MASLFAAAKGAVTGQAGTLREAAAAAARAAADRAKAAVTGKAKDIVGSTVATVQQKAASAAGAAAEKVEQKAAATALQQVTGLSAAESAGVARQASSLAGGTAAALSGVTSFFTSTGASIKSFGSYVIGGLNPFSSSATLTQKLVVWIPILCIILAVLGYIGSKRGWFTPKPVPATTAAALNAAVSANAPTVTTKTGSGPAPTAGSGGLGPGVGSFLPTVGGPAPTAENGGLGPGVGSFLPTVGGPAPTAGNGGLGPGVGSFLPTVGGTKEGFATADPVDPTTLPLVSLQPLTIKQAGFLGPIPNGAFDVAAATGNALRAGFRSFTLQIDYLDTNRDPKNFASPGVATLLYHADDGSLISTNSGSINDVAKTISALAFRPEVPNYGQPVILYLHILRAPSPVKAQDDYLAFLSKIAEELNPLAPNHLGMSPLGVFHRQKNEDILLNTPISSFEGNVIILCNADTTMFRSSSLTTKYPPANDLDYWVNMRVYLNSEFEIFGLAQTPPTGVTANAVIVGLGSILGMNSQRMDVFSAKKRNQFVIAMPSNTSNPSYKDLETALSSAGVNMVPLDIFSDPLPTVKNLVKMYSDTTYHPKPVALQPVS